MTNANIIKKNERVIAYVDGFNLYFGLLEAGLKKLQWLNLRLLIENLLKANQSLVEIKYFTSRVSNNPDKQKRQTTYIEALEAVDVNIFYGHYQRDKIECYRCGHIWANYNEKMTDVNIATQMIIDACQDKYDMAMLISGDSDLVPPMKAISENFQNKRVFVAFPPKRHNNSVALVAKGSMMIGRKKFADSQFDDEVTKKDGFILKKPETWK
ncbi:MAG: NYN domain-containing protein [Bacteroidetes bacterium]|nr:NYN domain-containing protein [Bacteroidota bacterium]